MYIALLAVTLAAALPSQAEPPPNRPTTRATITTQEADLWRRITALEQAVPAMQPYEEWFKAAERQRLALSEKVRLYLTLYPGGAHRDEAIRIELATLFELGTLRGKDLNPLCERVAEYLRSPPSEVAEHEAAFWQIICRRFETSATTVPATDQPTSAPFSAPDAALLAAYRRYIQHYPSSRHVPRLATLLYEDAARRVDRGAQHAILAHLREHFPSHAVTRALQAARNRTESVGRPFWLSCRTTDGRALDTRKHLGQPVLIVVWAGYDESARRRVQEVEQFRRAHPSVHVVGVSLDESPEKMAFAARELGIAWPQYNDGLGWGNEFVRMWGVRRLPCVFVIDRAGRLQGAGSNDRWRSWAEASLIPSSDRPAELPGTDGGGLKPGERQYSGWGGPPCPPVRIDGGRGGPTHRFSHFPDTHPMKPGSSN